MPEPIFVFGSNLAGIHGAGAARYAILHHGAIVGQGIGRQGNSYAIPTKDASLQSLPLGEIYKHILDFCVYALKRPESTFHVTRVGCGLAGYSDWDIADMFSQAPMNCKFSLQWAAWLPWHEDWTDK